MLFSSMINQLKCTEPFSLKKSILKGDLFGYDPDRKVRISPSLKGRDFTKDKGGSTGKQY